MHSSEIAIIIPARYGSTRLPGKSLIKVGNKPIIQWVWERAKQVKSADLVIIATDNEEIFNTAKAFGADVEMTAENHSSGFRGTDCNNGVPGLLSGFFKLAVFLTKSHKKHGQGY